jgi:hypothetical protein
MSNPQLQKAKRRKNPPIAQKPRKKLLCRIFSHQWETDHIHSALSAVLSRIAGFPVQCSRCGKKGTGIWIKGEGVQDIQEIEDTQPGNAVRETATHNSP